METEKGPPRTVTRAYSLIQRMQDKASELELQTDMATTGSLTQARALTIEEPQDAYTLSRRAQSTLLKSVTENGDESGNLHLSMSINPSTSNTLRLSTPKLTKHQPLGTTIMSRSGSYIAEQHEQDMLEELDKMHEECHALQEEAKLSEVAVLNNDQELWRNQQHQSALQRHQESYMRRELKWESTLAHLQQQLGLLKGEGTVGNAAATAEEQAKQLNAIRDLHKEVMAGIDEAVDRHAHETDKVDLATLKQLKRRVNALEEQIHNDKQKQLSEDEAYQQKTQALREELDAMRAAAANFDQLHLAAAGEVVKLRQAQALEQGQAHLLVKQVAALKRDNHLLKEDLAAAETELANWYETMQRETEALKLAYQPAEGLGTISPHRPATASHPTSPTKAFHGTPLNSEVELLKQQLEKEQRRAATAELALAKGQHLQRLLQAAVHAVLQARGPVQALRQSESAAAVQSSNFEQHMQPHNTSKALFASLALVPPPDSLKSAINGQPSTETSHCRKQQPQTARPCVVHQHAMQGKGHPMRPQTATAEGQLPDPAGRLQVSAASVMQPALQTPQLAVQATSSAVQRNPSDAKLTLQSGQQTSATALQGPRRALQRPQTALQRPQTAMQRPQTALQRPQTALQTSQSAQQRPQTTLQRSQKGRHRPNSALQTSDTAKQRSSTQQNLALHGPNSVLQRPASALQTQTPPLQKSNTALQRPQSAISGNWQHPHSAQGSKQAPFWLGYMQQPQTLHAYWISEKLQPAPPKQVQHDRPVPASRAAVADQPGAAQQHEAGAQEETRVNKLQREAGVAEDSGDAAAAADLLQQQQQRQQEQQQLISPTASDAFDIELDVSSIEQEANTDLGTAANGSAANLKPNTTDCMDAAEPNSNGATSVHTTSVHADMGLVQETVASGSSRGEQSHASSHTGMQSPHKCSADDPDRVSALDQTAACSSQTCRTASAKSANAALQDCTHTREEMLPDQAVHSASIVQQHSRLRGARPRTAHSIHVEPKQDAADSLTAQERRQVIEQLLMQDEVMQLIQDQLSTSEQPSHRAEAVPTALHRPATPVSSHPHLTQPDLLQVRQQHGEGKENAGKHPWHITAVRSEAEFLAGRSM